MRPKWGIINSRLERGWRKRRHFCLSYRGHSACERDASDGQPNKFSAQTCRTPAAWKGRRYGRLKSQRYSPARRSYPCGYAKISITNGFWLRFLP
jgi:hypothetical protein